MDASLSALVVQRHLTMADAIGRVISEVGPGAVTVSAVTREQAMSVARRLAPDVALVDLDLSPDSSLIAGLAEASPSTRIIVMVERSLSGSTALLEALRKGAVGVMHKESSPEELARALTSSLSSPVLAEETAGLLLDSFLGSLQEKRFRDIAVIEALAAAAEVRDLTTGEHLHRVAELARAVLAQTDNVLARNEEVGFGFLLHDIGKIGVPDAVLNKPGPLVAAEWDVMRRHPELGVKIVAPIGFPSVTTDVILHHHERWDGLGYPAGLKGEGIPLVARVFSVADAFDAMTTDRPYRAALPPGRAMEVIAEAAGTAYDPDVVEVFVALKAGSRDVDI